MPRKTKGDGDSVEQRRGPEPLSETVRAKKKTSTSVAFDRTTDKGGTDNAQVRAEYTVMHRVHIVLQDFMTVTLTCCFL